MFLSRNILNQHYYICVGCLYQCKSITCPFFKMFKSLFFISKEQEISAFFAAISGNGNLAVGWKSSFFFSFFPKTTKQEWRKAEQFRVQFVGTCAFACLLLRSQSRCLFCCLLKLFYTYRRKLFSYISISTIFFVHITELLGGGKYLQVQGVQHVASSVLLVPPPLHSTCHDIRRPFRPIRAQH